MNCPITYEELEPGRRYSGKGLRPFAPRLTDLRDFPYTAEEQRNEAVQRSGKMSVQGVQPKVSAVLNVREQNFEIVDSGGKYILKPQHLFYPELPENEDLTMRLAAAAGIDTPLHALIYSKDHTLTYVVKRFDRIAGGKKLAMEDFAQLLGKSRDTKYESSMEHVASVLDYCTFPVPEKLKLLRLTTINFLVGNEDAHLKNFSLLTRDGITTLSPAYDIVNTTIAIKEPVEEIALPLHGKKRNLTRSLFFEYYAFERLGLNPQVVETMIGEIRTVFPVWNELIDRCFLSNRMKEKYRTLLNERKKRLEL